MARCVTCGNEYERPIEVEGQRYARDGFECAIHPLAPRCNSDGRRLHGRRTQLDDWRCCSAPWARNDGVVGPSYEVETRHRRLEGAS